MIDKMQEPSSLCGTRKKGREEERRKARKRGKGKGAPAIRTGVFVFCPPFSQLCDNVNCQYVTNHK